MARAATKTKPRRTPARGAPHATRPDPEKANGQPVRVEYIDLEALQRWPRNPKQHDIGALHQSLKRWGFVAPIIVDESTGRIVAGHGRLDALQQLQASGDPAPGRIHVQDGRWRVPVVRGIAFPSETDAEAYLIADNRLTILGGWDDAALADLLTDLAKRDALDGTGYDEEDLERLLKDTGDLSPTAESVALTERWQVLVTCVSETEQTALLDRFTREGLTCRALIA